MKVYRVEDAVSRKGMYHSGAAENTSLGLVSSTTHPMPNDDTELERARMANLSLLRFPHRFGFESIESLRRWLYNDTWLTELDGNGCVINVYEVPSDSVLRGTTQLEFSAKYHTTEHIVGTLSLTSLINNANNKQNNYETTKHKH